MNRFKKIGDRLKRRGAVLNMMALLLTVLIGVVALTVDLGYVYVVRGQAQCAADAAVLAAAAYSPEDTTAAVQSAQRFAGLNTVANGYVPANSVIVDFGSWDAGGGVFQSTPNPGNAVRVTIQRDATHGGSVPLFFAPVIGQPSFDVNESAVAMTNARDIVFVLDLSGSMNNDTEPAWATAAVNNAFASLGYSTIGTDLMQQVYTDFNFGTFPGTLQYVGEPLSIAQDGFAYAEMTTDSGELSKSSIPATYRIASSDSEATRKFKAYSWIIDQQLATLMPNARPAPSSSDANSYALWSKYLDYVIQPQRITQQSTKGKPRPSYPVNLPPSQSTNTLPSMGNPYLDAYPTVGTTELNTYRNKLGYRTYVQFMMDFGVDGQPAPGQYTQLSRNHPNCPWHSESTDGGTFLFPPREQPTHAARRALIATINLIQQRNEQVTESSQKDRVAIVTFARSTDATLVQSLTSNYADAMGACVKLQAVADDTSSTATEYGLILGKNHIAPASEGGQGRMYADKVVVLMTDGIPNLYSSGSSTISGYIGANANSNWYSGSLSNPYNAALMQAMVMQKKGWKVFMVGLGLGTDYDFMDRAARVGGSANKDAQAPRGSGNPAVYEERLKTLFSNIITNPAVRIVQ